MLSKSLRLLVNRAGGDSKLWFSGAIGVLSALAVPVLFLIIGQVIHILVTAESGKLHPMISWTPQIDNWLPDVAPLAKVSILLGLALAIAIVIAILTHSFYRLTQKAAVDFEVNTVETLRNHSKQLAVVRTLSAQQTALVDGLEYHLPRVRVSLARWWRTYPRHLIQCLGCLFIAFAIQPLLTAITLVGASLLSLIFRWFDARRRTTLPVVRERAAHRRTDLVALCVRGPLLESVHEEKEVSDRFHDLLSNYRKEAIKSLTSSSWKTPLIIAIVGILACAFVFVVAVQVLRPEAKLSVAAAVTFLLAGIGATVSAMRLQRSYRELVLVNTAADELQKFLALPVEKFDATDLKSISKVTQRAVLDHVTLQDSSGRKLLENVSIVFQPGCLMGVVASEQIQAQALVELLMGYGRPVSGRLLLDDVLISDLRPDSLAKCSLWVSPDGPLVTGTVQDNLIRNGAISADLNTVLQSARVLEAVRQLPDGLSTLITPDDDRLIADAPFRLGLARAKLRQPSIVVIEEPSHHVDAKTEQETIEAIRNLVQPSLITVLLPQRLPTLRHCDTLVLIHEHKVVDIGTHAELLQRSELYRHLNYVRFNPFRAIG